MTETTPARHPLLDQIIDDIDLALFAHAYLKMVLAPTSTHRADPQTRALAMTVAGHIEEDGVVRKEGMAIFRYFINDSPQLQRLYESFKKFYS